MFGQIYGSSYWAKAIEGQFGDIQIKHNEMIKNLNMKTLF